MGSEGAALSLVPVNFPRSTVVTLTGTLSLLTYPQVRDGLLKIATDTPHAVIADIHGLTLDDDALASVFAVIARRIGDWPGIPFALVTSLPEHRAALASRAVDRFVAVHDDVETAERGLENPPCRVAAQTLVSSDAASASARQFVRQVCDEWQVPQHLEDAQLIATEFVENTIRHTFSWPHLRLELRRGVLTVSVADDDPRQAVLLERLSPAEPGMGLRMVTRVARLWGCSRSWSGGKVVWAVLTTGDSRHRTGGGRLRLP
jgi:anti-sigma regulatory factor (Ser/Thr protein kinase)/anti-anti-sigma regulatory factor